MSLPPRPSRSSRPASASEPTHAETVPQRELADFAGQALPDPREVEAASSTRWLVGLGRRKGAMLLMGAAVLTVAGMAWALATLLAPLGSAAAAVAAGLGMLLLMLPMMALLLKLAHQLERAHQMLQRLDTSEVHQPLPSRGQFIALVEREFARARRYGSGAGVAIVEVDRFRRLAELRGPAAGEAVMRELASLIGQTLRGADALAMYAPAQMVVFLANSDPTGSLDACERIRERAEALEVLWREQRIRVTVSAGVVTVRPAHQHVSALLQEVETALAAARDAGGNCVRLAPVEPAAHGHSPGAHDVGDSRAAGPF